MKKFLLQISIVTCIFMLITSVLNAGTTGKITGVVTDQESGEPLPGINVMIDGTTMGAATDIDGVFVINNIPPGIYSVVASGVGFQKQMYTDVKVSADFTTKIDFVMSTDIIEVETIVVRAEAAMVRKDLTSSQTNVDASQIEALPVESVTGLLTLQAGITQGTGGELHIRGGRSTEIQYTINGVSISNPYSNSRAVSIATNAIQELSVISGTFNAEYGNALSGIVNTVTKEGSDKYKGSFSFYTGDYLSNNTDIFYKIDDFNPVNEMVFEGTLGGPIPCLGKKFSFFLSGRYNKDQGHLYGIREHNVSDRYYISPTNSDSIYIQSTGDGAEFPMNPYEGLSTTGKLTYKPISTMKINYDVIYSKSQAKYYSHAYKYLPDARPTGYSWGLVNSLELRHAISNYTFYTLRGSYNVDDYKSYLYPLEDEDGDPVDFHAGMNPNDYYPSNKYQPSEYLNTPVNYTFYVGGTPRGHSYQRTNSTQLKFDITSQLTNHHEAKFGIEYKTHELNYESFTILRDTSVNLTPVIPDVSTSYRDSYVRTPTEFSAFIQDKIEFDEIILNLGVRMDYISPDARYSTNTFYPSPNDPELPSYIDANSLLADAEAKYHISPRFGVSFPITDQGIIHFSYGHFVQMPPFRYLYANPQFEWSATSQQYGNADLKPEKTVTYELGLQQQLMEDLALHVTGYYKDVRDLLSSQQIRIDENSTYYKYVNKDYANIKGIIVSVAKRPTPQDMLGFTLDYTFQVAEGNDTDSDAFFLDLLSGRQSEKVPIPLGWDQRHTLNGTVSFGEVDNWNVTLVGVLSTGLPYSPVLFDNQVYLKPNSGRRPMKGSVDLRAEKTFKLDQFSLTFFAKVFNLFDTQNENLVYSSTGRSGYTLDKTLATSEETNRLSQINPGLHSADEYFVRPDYYSSPRQVRLGVTVDF